MIANALPLIVGFTSKTRETLHARIDTSYVDLRVQYDG